MTASSQSKYFSLGTIIVLLGALFYAYEYFLRVIPGVLAPELMHSFSINATAFGTLSAFYFYAYTPMQLIVGPLVDRYNTKFILMLALIACICGNAILGITHLYVLATIARFLQGFGSAFAFVGVLKLTAMWCRKEHFAFYAGLATALGYLGAGLGEIVLDSLNSAIGWRPTIQAFTIVGIILLLLFFFISDQRDTKHNTKAQIVTFPQIWSQVKVLLNNRRIWIAAALAALLFMPTSVFAALWGITYLKAIYHYSPHQATFAVAMIFIGWAIGAPTAGAFSDWLGTRIKVMRVAALFAFIIATVLLYWPVLPFPLVCFCFLLFGICSASETLAFVMARDLCKSEHSGTAIAIVNCASMLGGLLLQRGIGELLDWHWHGSLTHGLRVYTMAQYKMAIIVVPIGLALAFLISCLSRDTLHPKSKSTAF